MTRYYVDIAPELVAQIERDDSALPEGWRLIERWGPKYRDMERWLVEDDYAGEEFEDCLVELLFQSVRDGDKYFVEITRREILPSRY